MAPQMAWRHYAKLFENQYLGWFFQAKRKVWGPGDSVWWGGHTPHSRLGNLRSLWGSWCVSLELCERNSLAVPGLCEFGCGITCLLYWVSCFRQEAPGEKYRLDVLLILRSWKKFGWIWTKWFRGQNGSTKWKGISEFDISLGINNQVLIVVCFKNQ